MNISTKLKIIPLCILVMTLISSAIIQLSYQGIHRNASDSKKVVGVIVNIYELSSLTLEYLQYHEERPFVQWQLKNTELHTQLNWLHGEDQNNDQILSRLLSLQQKITTLFAQVVKEHEPKLKNDNNVLHNEQLVVHLQNQIMVTLYSMVSLAVDLSHNMQHEQVKTHKTVGWGLFWINIISGTVLVILSFSITRTILLPLKELKDAADIVGSGNFDHQIRSKEMDEIGVFSRSFDFMVRRLQQETDKQYQLQNEVRHLDRVAMLGTLTTSIAHEINQPLAAILTNAQAAKRFLSFKEPDLNEIEEALTDIVADDKRAAEVIRRLRTLLSKNESQLENVDINIIVREIISLVKSDLMIRNIRLEEKYTPDLPELYCDKIQIQQVILNLVTNSIDSVHQKSEENRFIKVTTRIYDLDFISISICDSGLGIHDSNTDLLFEPFHTTKKHGLGMGLPISKTIVENHSGRIWAENNSDGGATFTIILPVQGESTNRAGYVKG